MFAKLLMLWSISIRSLISHRAKSLIVGSIIFFGTFLVVLGTALLDSVERTMAESITSSLAGHIQIYDSEAKDRLALFGGGFMGAEDIGRIDDFKKVKDALSSIDGIKAIVPMGMDMATVTSAGELDQALSELRHAIREGETEPVPGLKRQIREIAEQMQTEAKNRAKITKDKEKIATSLAILDKVVADDLWKDFDEKPLDVLEFLDTKLAPLAEEGRIIYFRYVGTDLRKFAENFDKFEIVKGKMVPPNTRGFLFNQKFYDDWVKHYVARTLDKINRGVTQEARTIGDDPLLQALARQAAGQYRRITYQLDAHEADELRPKLQQFLNSKEEHLDQLVQEFLKVTDENIAARYKFFYDEIAPKIDLYAVDVGETMTLRAFTRSGFLKSVNVKVFGTFRFKGLDRSDLAGGHNLMDLLTFRELYGLMTEDKLAELEEIKEEVGLREIGAASAEDELFGSTTAAAEVEENTAFDEFAGGELENVKEAETATQTFTTEDMESGLALNAAVILDDPARLKEVKSKIDEVAKADSLRIQTVDWQTASGIVGQFIIVIRSVLYLAIAIIFLVALVIINNSMVTATMERVTEIGTMRAIGARRSWVLFMFMVETMVLGLIAGALGMAAGAGAIELLGMTGIPAPSDVLVFLFGGPRLYPEVGPQHLVIAFIAVVFVSVASTLYPAVIATGIQPVTAMRAKE